MAVKNADKANLKKLKKQVRILQRKETQTRNKLRAALKKASKLGRGYKSKLASKARVMKSKLAETQISTYAKIAADIERQLVKNIEIKAKALRSVITQLEKKSIAKLAETLCNKGKKSGKTKSERGSGKVKSVKKTRKSGSSRAK